MYPPDLEGRGSLKKYEYLYRCLRRDIRSGALRTGVRLASKRDLAERLGVSVSTVERAYDLLASEGYVMARPGSGFYVSEVAARELPEEEAPEEAAEEGARRVFDANANRNGIRLFPANTWVRCMRRILSAQDSEMYETVPLNGLYELRKAIAEYLFESRGIAVDPACVVVGAGTEYLYSRLIHVLAGRPRLATGDIYPKKLVQIARNSGATWEFVTADMHGMRTEELASTTAQAVHVSPANLFPTGAVLPMERREELLRWVEAEPRRLVIEDDYDSELRYSQRSLPTLFGMCQSERVIYLNTFSKTLVPSIRISYMVLPHRLMEVYRDQAGFYSCTASSLEQATLAEFISEGHFRRHINHLRRYYRRQRDAFVEAIGSSRLSLVGHLMPSEVGTHLLLSVDTRMSDRQIVEAAAERSLRLDMLSDHCASQDVLHAGYVVLNTASVEEARVGELVAILEDVFADDVARASAGRRRP